MITATVHEATTKKIFDGQKRAADEKDRNSRLAGFRYVPPFTKYVPPPVTHRPVIDVAHGVKVRSYYDGALN